MRDPKILADEHWQWLQGLYDSLPSPVDFNVSAVEYLYKTAFVHGYKHAIENIKKELPCHKSTKTKP